MICSMFNVAGRIGAVLPGQEFHLGQAAGADLAAWGTLCSQGGQRFVERMPFHHRQDEVILYVRITRCREFYQRPVLDFVFWRG